MDEKRLLELIARKLAGEATPEELRELKELSAQYPDAGDTEKLLAHVWGIKDEDQEVDAYYQRYRKRYATGLDELDNNEPGGSLAPSWKKYILPVTLSVLLLCALGSYYFFNNSSTGGMSPAMTEIVSGRGIRKSVKLPDGTSVFLNSDSKISFDNNMLDRKQRVVTLSGEAYFDVVHLADRPFIIHTAKISIRVLGTAFNVKAYPTEKDCQTTLIRGSIELSMNSGDHRKLLMKPSEKLTVTYEKKKNQRRETANDSAALTSTLLIENIEPVKVSDKEYVPETSWTENRLIFDNEKLEDLAPKLERWYNVKISIVGQGPAGQRFTGAFANESVVQALTALKLIKPFNFTVHDNNITIY